jgi:tetratricopeptide (TPR) repeat protein
MSSERRHQLEHNELAVWLFKVNKSIEPYSKQIAILVSLSIVALLAWSFLSSEEVAKRSDATLQLIQASGSGDAVMLGQVAESYQGTASGSWAKLYEGQALVSQGIQTIFTDRTGAEELLQQAEDVLLSAVNSSTETLLVSRGHYGIAQAREALGEVEKAIESYNQVIQVNESEAMVKRAEARIEALERPESQAFLAWFSEQDFSPPDPSLPPTLPGGNTLPEMPEIGLPTLDLGVDGETTTPEGGLELPEIVSEPAEEAAATEEGAAADTAEPAGDSTTEAAPAPAETADTTESAE